jgi:16S rRNA (adenine1518-N6/adenine1519-N6)-dimethyltransferase
MTLLFQKEVAERIYAGTGNKTYGRLSILAQWLCETRRCFDIPRQAFTPAPKITSTLIHLKPKPLDQNRPAFAAVEKITAAAFGQRRKMVRSSLKEYSKCFESAAINPELRAEDIPVETYIKLASLIFPA